MLGPFCITCEDFIYGKDAAVGDNRVCEKCVRELADQIGVVAAKDKEDLLSQLADEIADSVEMSMAGSVRRVVEDAVDRSIRALKNERLKERLARA